MTLKTAQTDMSVYFPHNVELGETIFAQIINQNKYTEALKYFLFHLEFVCV